MVFAGGGGQSQRTTETSSTADYVGPNRSYSGYPLPITERPLELTGMLQYAALRPDAETTAVWDWFFERTNVRVRPVMINDSDRASVIFASRDFPDFYMSGGNANLLSMAVRDGDIIPLDELLQRNAPTWNRFLNENPMVKNGNSIDGKIYFLPFINWEPGDRNMRDVWVVGQSWLDELGISTPTTTEEIKNAAIAIKNNAGRGTIPGNVIPYYYIFDSYIGGQFDVYGAFGINITSADYLVVENGRVIFQATNPELIAPLKYLQELYREGLTPPECFTDDWNTYLTKIFAVPPILGIYTAANITSYDTHIAIPPPQSPTGKKPTIRRQAFVSNTAQNFAIFENCKDPAAITKYAEFIAFDLEASMNMMLGMKDVHWRFRPDGKPEFVFTNNQLDMRMANSRTYGLWNSFIGLWDTDFYVNKFYDRERDIRFSRAWNLDNVYKDHLAPEGSVYISAPLSPDENSIRNAIRTDLENERRQTFARWITTNANIDSEWDAYVARMNRFNINEFVALSQKAYDLMVR